MDFSTRDDVDQALLLIKAIFYVPSASERWVEFAERLLESSGKRSHKALKKAIEGLVDEGLVVRDASAWMTEYSMSPGNAQEIVVEAHAGGMLSRAIEHLRVRSRPTYYYQGGVFDDEALVWSARAFLRAGAPEAAQALLRTERTPHSSCVVEGVPWPLAMLGLEPEAVWLEAMPDDVLIEYSKALGRRSLEGFLSMPEVIGTLLEVLSSRKIKPSERNPIDLLRGAVLTMATDRARRLIKRGTKLTRAKVALLHAFASGDLSRAYALGSALLESRPEALRGVEALAFALAALNASRNGDANASASMARMLEEATRHRSIARTALDLLEMIAHVESGRWDSDTLDAALDSVFDGFGHVRWPEALVAGLLIRWFEIRPSPTLHHEVTLIALEGRHVSSSIVPATFAAMGVSQEDDGAWDGTLLEIYRPRPAWEHIVDGFESLADELVPQRHASAPFRPTVFWEVSGTGGALSILPRLVSSPKSPRGRKIDVEDLLMRHADMAKAADARAAQVWVHACEALVEHRPWDLVGDVNSQHVTLHLAVALVGHPDVRNAKGTRVEVMAGTPSLVIDGDGTGARIFVEPAAFDEFPIVVEWEKPQMMVVYSLDAAWISVLRLLRSTGRGTSIPSEAMQRLLPALTRLGGQVHIEGRGSMNLEGREVEPCIGIEVDLEWKDPELHLHVAVWPLGRDGPPCDPGQGEAKVVAHDSDGPVSTVRALDAEREALQTLRSACPRLETLPSGSEDSLHVEGVEQACLVFEELVAAAEQGHVTLGWPRGKPLRLSREYTSADFNVRVRRSSADWLELDASVTVDDGEVLAWRLLCEDADAAGRFVRLGSGEVLRLSGSLRRKLDALRRMDASGGGGETVTVPEVTLSVLEGVLGEDSAVSWTEELAQRREAIEGALSSTPRLPRGLKATLRDYQRQGVRWMLRLADAGLGAVLADDMGLGKTVQTLAVLLSRAKIGPAIVVCPTSVIGNWVAEAERFAPKLEVLDVGATPRGERTDALMSLGPGGVAVMSYGLISRLDEVTAELHIASLVFDEAHALKNARASRTQVATSISADFRLGLTGTPMENHLGELWSVVNTCVPGLLGPEDVFSRGLAKSVEGGDAAATEHLRALLQPFLLRRTKDMVLSELPERTETTIAVQQGKSERAWYEAQRRRAVDRMAQIEAPKGQARIQILAEIGRLRQAAVDPRLVDSRAPRGSKLDMVVTRVAELVSAGHQVLVFTQFIKVLGMLEGRLKKRGVRTLELQGSTPAAERARRIEAFQDGEADAFLMSLKAGGVGVNLTAADYVIHVDPWWNPAVEDQASGRAHRMGQTKPVTVYRFCTEGSIEPKILALHESKRQLAEDVLSGMGKSTKLDLDALRELML